MTTVVCLWVKIINLVLFCIFLTRPLNIYYLYFNLCRMTNENLPYILSNQVRNIAAGKVLFLYYTVLSIKYRSRFSLSDQFQKVFHMTQYNHSFTNPLPYTCRQLQNFYIDLWKDNKHQTSSRAGHFIFYMFVYGFL